MAKKHGGKGVQGSSSPRSYESYNGMRQTSTNPPILYCREGGVLRAIFILALVAGIARADGSSAKDVLLSSYYVGKASVPFFILPEALDDGDMVLLLDLGLFAVMTVPASGVLFQRWIGSEEHVGFWRKINLGTDLALAGGVALYGLYEWSKYEPDPYHSYDFNVGGLYILASALYGLVSLAEMIPFSSESHFAVQPIFSPMYKSTGLAVRFQY